MKKQYTTAKIDVMRIEIERVLTASSGTPEPPPKEWTPRY